jgi:quercetin dioxygenase-like cupin family protein
MNRREMMKNSPRMLVGVLRSALPLLVAAGATLAQDVMKVSPETHKVLLENDQVRVLGVRVKPGEKVGLHSHPASVIYYLSDGKIKFTKPDGKTEERKVKAGAALWSEPSTHVAENVGNAEFREVHIELKAVAKNHAGAK